MHGSRTASWQLKHDTAERLPTSDTILSKRGLSPGPSRQHLSDKRSRSDGSAPVDQHQSAAGEELNASPTWDHQLSTDDKYCVQIQTMLSAHCDDTWRWSFAKRIESILMQQKPRGERWSLLKARLNDKPSPKLLVSGEPMSGKAAAIMTTCLVAKRFGCFTVVLTYSRDAKKHLSRVLLENVAPIPCNMAPQVLEVQHVGYADQGKSKEIKDCMMNCGVLVLNYSDKSLKALVEAVWQLRGAYGEWCDMVLVKDDSDAFSRENPNSESRERKKTLRLIERGEDKSLRFFGNPRLTVHVTSSPVSLLLDENTRPMLSDWFHLPPGPEFRGLDCMEPLHVHGKALFLRDNELNRDGLFWSESVFNMYRDAHPEGEEEQRAGVLLLDFANPHLQHNVSESRRAQGLKPPAAHKVDGMRSRPDRVQQEFPRCIVVSCSSSVISVRYPRGEWISDHRLRQIVEHRRGGREPLGTIAALDAELPPLKSQQQADHWVALSDVLECLDLPESVARASEARMMPIVVLCSAHATVGAFQSVFRVPTHFIGRSSGSLDEMVQACGRAMGSDQQNLAESRKTRVLLPWRDWDAMHAMPNLIRILRRGAVWGDSGILHTDRQWVVGWECDISKERTNRYLGDSTRKLDLKAIGCSFRELPDDPMCWPLGRRWAEENDCDALKAGHSCAQAVNSAEGNCQNLQDCDTESDSDDVDDTSPSASPPRPSFAGVLVASASDGPRTSNSLRTNNRDRNPPSSASPSPRSSVACAAAPTSMERSPTCSRKREPPRNSEPATRDALPGAAPPPAATVGSPFRAVLSHDRADSGDVLQLHAEQFHAGWWNSRGGPPADRERSQVPTESRSSASGTPRMGLAGRDERQSPKRLTKLLGGIGGEHLLPTAADCSTSLGPHHRSFAETLASSSGNALAPASFAGVLADDGLTDSQVDEVWRKAANSVSALNDPSPSPSRRCRNHRPGLTGSPGKRTQRDMRRVSARFSETLGNLLAVRQQIEVGFRKRAAAAGQLLRTEGVQLPEPFPLHSLHVQGSSAARSSAASGKL